MIEIPGYQIQEKIFESTRTRVFRAVYRAKRLPVVLKMPRVYQANEDYNHYQREFQLLSSLQTEGVIKTYGLERHDQLPVLVLEDFGASSLRELLSAGHMFPVEVFLSQAIHIVEILEAVHKAGVIHKDLNPSNILLNPNTGVLKIIDLGIATCLVRENMVMDNPRRLEGTPAYMSPEQTGRMNRYVDYRSDFYSLGVSFYEMLSGRLPFTEKDPLGLVHCHIAREPVPLGELGIPEELSKIVEKLMAKNADERYQSATGLVSDLRACLDYLKGIAPTFQLAGRDVSDHFRIPQKLYGRENALRKLSDAFHRVRAVGPTAEYQGFVELVLVSGQTGTGKSALVGELVKIVTERRGYFIAGKFDLNDKNKPYSALIEAFEVFVEKVLTEREELLTAWRAKILDAVANKGQVLIDLAPSMALILGSQPPLPVLGPSEAQNRFFHVIRQFIKAISGKGHPLVLFLDNLQWADASSLELLESLLLDEDNRYLLIVGAYRKQGAAGDHPLQLLIRRLKQGFDRLREINLKPLTFQQVRELLADTLHAEPAKVQELTDLVYGKTLGNPYFTTAFLESLHDRESLRFDHESRCWVWSIEEIRALSITDNVVTLLADRLERQPTAVRDILRLAACIGSSFDLATLAVVTEMDHQTLFSRLWPAVAVGFLYPVEPNYQVLIENGRCSFKFAHDRVRQAAYALIGEGERQGIHLKIGRLLTAMDAKDAPSGLLFEITDHMNMGRDLLSDPIEKTALAKSNLAAGRKAKQATAYANSLAYLKAGVSCMDMPDAWDTQKELLFELHHELSILEYLNGNFKACEQVVSMLLDRTDSAIQQAELYNVLILQYTLSGAYEKAIEMGFKGLALLGIDLPKTDHINLLKLELEKASELWQDQDITALAVLPEMSDTKMRIALQLLMNIDPPAYITDNTMYSLIIAKMVVLCLEYGPAAEGAKAIATYGVLLGALNGSYEQGHAFGQAAMALARRFGDQSALCKTSIVLGGWLNFWQRPYRELDHLFEEGFQCGIEAGEVQFAAYAQMYRVLSWFHQGRQLKRLLEPREQALQFAMRTNNLYAVDGMAAMGLILENLLGRSTSRWVFEMPDLTESQFLAGAEKHHSAGWLCTYLIMKGQTLYLYDNPSGALTALEQAGKYQSFILGMFAVVELNFYQCLSLAGIYHQTAADDRPDLVRKMDRLLGRLKHWSDVNECNFRHKYQLAAGEAARVQDRFWQASEFFEEAVITARKNGFTQDEALANELAARFWLSKGKDRYARDHLLDALYGYRRWGARAKAAMLLAQHPWLPTDSEIEKEQSVSMIAGSTSETSSGSGGSLDLISMMQVARTISAEIDLDKLLARVMNVVMENAGAREGFLILKRDDQLRIEAAASINKTEISLHQSLPIENSLLVSEAIVRYVMRSGQDVILENAGARGSFTRDPHVVRKQSKSLVCLPLRHQDEVRGVLYLENALVQNVFTKSRLEMLRMLAGQIGVSIENALLYRRLTSQIKRREEAEAELKKAHDALEERVRERTAQLREQSELLELVLNTVPHFIFWKDRQCQFLGCNHNFAKVAGWEHPSQIVGKTDFDMPWTKEEAEWYRKIDKQVMDSGQAQLNIEEPQHNSDSKLTTLLTSKVPLRSMTGEVNGILGIFMDITERKEKELEVIRRGRELDEKNALLQSLIDSIPDLIFFRDPGGAYLGCNRAFSDFAEVSSEEIRGKTSDEIENLRGGFYDESDQRIMTDCKPVQAEAWVTFPDGRRAFMLTLKTPYFGPDGKVLGLIGVSRDITERWTMEQMEIERGRQLDEVNRQLKAKNAEILRTQKQLVGQEKMASLGTMAAGIAHEIKNPLNFINNFAGVSVELVEELVGSMSESNLKLTEDAAQILSELRKNSEIIHKHGGRAAAIVQSMMKLAQGATGSRVRLDLNTLVGEYAKLVQKGRKAVRIQFEEIYDPALGKVDVEPNNLGRVLVNLLNNGIDAIAKRESLNEPDYRPVIRVETRDLGARAEIRVRDNGTGIPDDHKEKIFEPFFTTKPSGQGNIGLGLALCYDIVVQEHLGEFKVDTREGEYTQFIIVLPKISSEQARPKPPAIT